MICIKANIISDDLIGFINNKFDGKVEGVVHSVFENACNIMADNNLVSVVNALRPVSPMGLVVENDLSFKGKGIVQGQRVRLENNFIYYEDVDFCIDLTDAVIWDLDMLSEFGRCPEEPLKDMLTEFEVGILEYGKLFGVAELVQIVGNEFSELRLADFGIRNFDKGSLFIRERIVEFFKTMINGDVEHCTAASRKIIGYGPGLTPAVDDFLCGLMICFNYMAYYYKLNDNAIVRLNEGIARVAKGRTTIVSSEMLRHAATGKVNEDVRRLMLCLLGNCDEKGILSRLKRVIDIGETSGTDIALGIYVGCKILTNNKLRGVWTNECLC